MERQQAESELEALPEQAVPALTERLSQKTGLEVRRRIEGVLERITGLSPRPARLRELRALEVLERIGSPEAQRLLNDLAAGVPESGLTIAVKESLRRLSARP